MNKILLPAAALLLAAACSTGKTDSGSDSGAIDTGTGTEPAVGVNVFWGTGDVTITVTGPTIPGFDWGLTEDELNPDAYTAEDPCPDFTAEGGGENG